MYSVGTMKKFSLLVGTLGGTLAGYLFSNKTLRDQLSKAKDAEAAAKILGKHLSHDGKKIAKEVQAFVRSDEVQRNLTKAKKFAEKKLDLAKREAIDMMDSGVKEAKRAVKKGAKEAKGTFKRMKLKVRRVG